MLKLLESKITNKKKKKKILLKTCPNTIWQGFTLKKIIKQKKLTQSVTDAWNRKRD